MYYNDYSENNNIIALALAIGIIIIFAFLIGFLFFVFGYWLITLIVAQVFNFIIPFEWTYALGAYAILVIARLFMLPSNQSK